MCVPSNSVLSTGEVAVVIAVHAPDPHRPKVRVILDQERRQLEQPYERNLWEPQTDTGELASVEAPLDPAEFGVDPLSVMGAPERVASPLLGSVTKA